MYCNNYYFNKHNSGAVYLNKDTNRLYICIGWCNAEDRVSVVFFDGEIGSLPLRTADFDLEQASNLNEYWQKQRKKVNERNSRRRQKKSL